MPCGLFAYPTPSTLLFEEEVSAVDNQLAAQAARVGRLDAVIVYRANRGFLGKALWLCRGRPRKITGLQRLANKNLDAIRISAMFDEIAILNGQVATSQSGNSMESLRGVATWQGTSFWHALRFSFVDFWRMRFVRHRVIWQSS